LSQIEQYLLAISTNTAHINSLQKVNIKNAKKSKNCSIYMLFNSIKNT